MAGLGWNFHEGSRYLRGRVEAMAEPAAVSTPISLKRGFSSGGPSIFEIMTLRRSERNFDPEAEVGLDKLSDVLFAAQGVTSTVGQALLRTAPSAGGMYPINVYVAARKVEGLKQGCYKLDVENWSLVPRTVSDPGPLLFSACLGQEFVAQAAFNIILTAVHARTTMRYRDRGFRYVYMDAAHIGQNILLAAVSRGLGACAVGAFFDNELEAVVGVDGKQEVAVYLIPVGRLRKR